MLQISEFVWALRSSVWIVFNNFLLIDATDKSKISSDRKLLFFALRLYHLSFFASTPFNISIICPNNWQPNKKKFVFKILCKTKKSAFQTQRLGLKNGWMYGWIVSCLDVISKYKNII